MADRSDKGGWWVDISHWREQRLWAHTGCWQEVKCADGTVVKACIIDGRQGWWNGNYHQVRNVVEWFKPSQWFDGPEDLCGKEAEWDAYRASVFSGKSVLRAAA